MNIVQNAIDALSETADPQVTLHHELRGDRVVLKACGCIQPGVWAAPCRCFVLPAGFRSKSGLPVMNVAGCPTHPDWVTETLLLFAAAELGAAALDTFGRPRFYADHLVHHACPKNEFFEYNTSAARLSKIGCIMEHLGCVGTQAVGVWNMRGWNGEGSCTRADYLCINGTAPDFEEPRHSFTETPKFAGIPVGVPSAMPEAMVHGASLAVQSRHTAPDRKQCRIRPDRSCAELENRQTMSHRA